MDQIKHALRQRRTELIAHVWEQVTLRARPDYDKIFQVSQSVKRTGRSDLKQETRDRHQEVINSAGSETVRLARKIHSLTTGINRKKAQIKTLKERMENND